MNALKNHNGMVNVYEYYERMQNEQIILYFQGEITNNLLTSLLQLMDERMEKKQEDLKIRRRVFSVLLECLQNIYNYQQMAQFNSDDLQAATLMIKRTEEAYHILTGNYMVNTRVENLKNKIEKVNAMTAEELKELYKEVLSRQQMTDTGGAGLGLIDMARKSGDKIGYEFDHINDEHTFYTLQVKVLVG